jgi:hypothetical protein
MKLIKKGFAQKTLNETIFTNDTGNIFMQTVLRKPVPLNL